MTDFNAWEKKASFLRKLILTSTTEAGSGHATSCLSSVDMMTVLFDTYFSYDVKDPLYVGNDRLILSKGHASPLFYSLFAMSGAFPVDHLKDLRKFGSDLEGHPTKHFLFADAATGSLGQGLSVGAGIAIGLRKNITSPLPFVYVLMGDGELAEGQVWEAANFSSYYQLHNIVTMVDVNRLGQSQQTMFGHDVYEYDKRFQSFGFDTYVIDGHDFSEITNAFHDISESKSSKPKVILAKTIKGKGVSFLENRDNWHGKALSKEELQRALIELDVDESYDSFSLKKPLLVDHKQKIIVDSPIEIEFKENEIASTREAIGITLQEKAKEHHDLIVLDGDVCNSTYTSLIRDDYPDQFIQCFIAEQNMVSVAVGLSRVFYKPIIATFAAFLTRAADQIRMAAISQASLFFVGTHVGVEIGEDGPSQMGLEDISLFGTIPDSIVVQPSDAVSACALTSLLLKQRGIRYIRGMRSKMPVLYKKDEAFPLGGSKTLRSSSEDVLLVVASGVTVHEALKAWEELQKIGVHIRVIDCYSIKPLDISTLKKSLQQTKKNIIITVEDHFQHGGLGDFVMSQLAKDEVIIHTLSVTHISRSGLSTDLLSDAKIDALSIVNKVKELV